MVTNNTHDSFPKAFPGTFTQFSPTWVRVAYGLFTLWFALLGAHMLIDPVGWYSATPGVSNEGPMNDHFIRDIGAAFVMVAIAYAFSLQKGASWQLPAVAAVLPALHGAIHLFSAITGHSHGTAMVVELFGVILPGGIAVTLPIIHFRHQIKGGMR